MTNPTGVRAAPLLAVLAAIVALICLCLSGAAEAAGRGAPSPWSATASWRLDAPSHHARHAHRGARRHAHRQARRHARSWRLAISAASHLPVSAAPTRANPRGAPAASAFVAPSLADGAAGMAWRGGTALVAEAAAYVGSGKFTQLPGAWCADAVSFWLKAIGRPPLANRMAASALGYGRHVDDPQPGDLAVMRTRRGYAGHVGIVERVEPDGSIALVSGNWRGRVARSVISRASVTAFVRP